MECLPAAKFPRVRRVWVVPTVVVAVAMGCTTNTGSARVSGPAGPTAIGQASRVDVSGLSPGQRVTVTVTSTDARQVRWRSRTEETADRSGHLSLDAVALITAMTPLDPDPAGAYFWSRGTQAFRVQVSGVSTTVLRRLAPHPIYAAPVTADGLVGTYYSARLAGRHSAVLLIGGSEGGTPGPLLPALLAGDGHPVLALAYFKAPGLPDSLADIPLEYFATALRWLSRQPGVDPDHLVVDGDSRGGEAALLIGATFPTLVHGVVAGVPSNVAVCSYPGCTGPAWTLHGRPVPFTRQFNDPYPTDDPRAVIQVEHINGPVLLNCGGLDPIWHSCAYARAVMSRLGHRRFDDQLQACSDCDHFVGRGIPGEPYSRVGRFAPSASDISTYPKFFDALMKLLGT